MNEQAGERWRRIEALLDAALDLPPGDRAPFLARACEGDATLREEVERLARACDTAERFLETPATEFAAPLIASASGARRESDLQPGAVIGHYEILERGGYGGMGIVYKARDLRLGRNVALKFLPAALSDDATARARLTAEARAISALDHPHIAVVHDIAETGSGQQFIVLTWYDGVTLRELLADRRLEIAQAVQLAAQLASALSAAHAAGVVHRDVKPSNILVLPDGTPKLLDFGIAKTAGSEITREGATVGTVAYMSPEQTRGDPIDTRTDIWSLGVVLYELLSGMRPFRGDDDQSVIYSIRNDDPVPLVGMRPEVGDELSELVGTCLAKSPELRCGSAGELLDRLRAVGDGSWVREAGNGRSAAAAPPRVRIRAVTGRRALLAVGALVAGAVTAGAWWVRGASAEARLDPRRVVVAPLENRTGDARLDAVGQMAADWIVRGLSETRRVDVVSAPGAFGSGQPAGGPADGTDSRNRLRALAAETRAAIVLSGSFYQHGDSLYLTAQVSDAARQRVLHSLEPVSTPAAFPLNGVTRLRDALMSALAPRLFPMEDYGSVVAAPPSYDAYREFIQGVQLLLAREVRSSILHFTAAAAQDSTFVLPLIHAGVAYSLLGQLATTDSLLAVMRPRTASFNEVERLAFEMLEARVRGDMEQFYRLSLRAPTSARGTAFPWRLAVPPAWVNRPREAIRLLRASDFESGELRGWHLNWVQLGWAHHVLGEHREELRQARRARTLYPADTLYPRLEVHALAAMGRVRELRSLLAQYTEGSPSRAGLLRIAGVELQMHGRVREGEALLRESLEWQLARPSPEPRHRLYLAQSHALVGNLDEAEALLLTLEPVQPIHMEVRTTLGTVAARRGDRSRALEISEWLAALDRPYLHGAATYRRARIAAQLGDDEEAVRLLRQAYSEGFALWQAAHIDPDLIPLRRYPLFQEFMRPRG